MTLIRAALSLTASLVLASSLIVVGIVGPPVAAEANHHPLEPALPYCATACL
jgi:hypothetical protein